MPALHGSGNLSGSAQSLLDLLGLTAPQDDPACCLILLTADDSNSNEIRGGVSGVSATDWGFWIPTPATSVPAAPIVLGPFDRGGPVKLSEVFVLGTADEDLHVFYVWW